MRKLIFLYSLFLLLLLSCNNIKSKNNTSDGSITQMDTILVNNQDENTVFTGCEFSEDDIVDLGIGIAVWNYDCDKNIVIYKDSLLEEKNYDVNICTTALNRSESPCPLFYKPDYGIYHFVVTKFSKKWYQIIYNGNQEGYIPSDSIFEFADWGHFLKDYSTGVKQKTQTGIYIVKSVNGNKMTVVDEANNIETEFFWKNENKLLIDILLL